MMLMPDAFVLSTNWSFHRFNTSTAAAASRQMGDAAILARKTGTSAIPKTRRIKPGSH